MKKKEHLSFFSSSVTFINPNLTLLALNFNYIQAITEPVWRLHLLRTGATSETVSYILNWKISLFVVTKLRFQQEMSKSTEFLS